MSKLKISIIQSNLSWENKVENLLRFEEKIKDISDTELVLLPEMFSTGFSMNPYQLAEPMEGAGVQWMKKIASKKNIILLGSLIIEENNNYYNRAIWMLPNGKYGTYDKRHLFSYAGEDKHYSAGSKRLITQVKGWKVNIQICYDLRFPVWSRMQHSEEYDMIVYLANWPERRALAWKTLLQARAIENQCYVIGVNRVGMDGNDIKYSGDSCVINPLGEILYSKSNEEDLHTITIDKEELTSIRNHFPFLKDKDGFALL